MITDLQQCVQRQVSIEQVLWFQVTVHNTVLMEILKHRHRTSTEAQRCPHRPNVLHCTAVFTVPYCSTLFSTGVLLLQYRIRVFPVARPGEVTNSILRRWWMRDHAMFVRCRLTLHKQRSIQQIQVYCTRTYTQTYTHKHTYTETNIRRRMFLCMADVGQCVCVCVCVLCMC